MKSVTNRTARKEGIIAALLILLAGATIPCWTVYYAGPIEVTGELGFLWTAVGHLSDTPNFRDNWFLDCQGWNIVLLIILLSAAGTVGLVVYRRSCEPRLTPEAEDYQEGQGGAVAGREELGVGAFVGKWNPKWVGDGFRRLVL
jgi:hypothetical protein